MHSKDRPSSKVFKPLSCVLARRGARLRERGFSGVEFLINIALLGVIIVLILRATSAIDYVAGTFIARQIEQLQLMVFAYREDHSFLPGDDPLAPRRFDRGPARTRVPNGAYRDLTDNDVIDGYFLDPDNPEGEQYVAWQDLRFAGKVVGDPDTEGPAAMVRTMFGGVVGFDGGNLGMEEGSLCLTELPGKAAEVIDQELDDGVIDTGNVVATARLPDVPDDNWGHYDEPDSEPYDPEKRYMLCTTQLPL